MAEEKQVHRSKQKIVIIDTGCANILSLRYAIERLDYEVKVSYSAQEIMQADKLFLPGVGTASEAMANLQQRGLVSLLEQLHQPVLGICLGMQLLGKYSEEKNNNEQVSIACLGFCNSPVLKMKADSLPLPHMGWNQVYSGNNHPLFKGIAEGSYFYFVHSYSMPVSQEKDLTIATCDYGSVFSAAIAHNNFYGVQFHPERSGQAGSTLIKNFLEL